MDLAFVTGWGPDTLTNLEGRAPCVREERVAVLGNRDFDRVRSAAIPPAAESRMHYRDLAGLRKPGIAQAIEEAIGVIHGDEARDIFLHFDVDVLDSEIMPAVDSPQSGGLDYSELTAALKAAFASGRITGMELTIFDPDLDSDGRFSRELAAVLTDALRAES